MFVAFVVHCCFQPPAVVTAPHITRDPHLGRATSALGAHVARARARRAEDQTAAPAPASDEQKTGAPARRACACTAVRSPLGGGGNLKAVRVAMLDLVLSLMHAGSEVPYGSCSRALEY
ncbi:unnamed protein product [Prorocentrum cordatum]|uniref:Uncharacterized protein n=1 Tax=Prorocentrum cordatum TaxID=2364126 RepID=A0ABN9TN03_9DINO|nr:unnamed protein product [Polarella glacialis]